MKYYEEILTPAARRLLPKLSEVEQLRDFYLVGGTALALYLGHRISIDFDFFTKKTFPGNIIDNFSVVNHNHLQVLSKYKGSVEFVLDGVKIFLWENYYPLIRDLDQFHSLRIAQPVDVGLLKIVALEGRSTWKDMVDLFFLDKYVIELEDLADIYRQTYPEDKHNNYSSLKVLLNRQEIEKTPKPDMLTPVNYDEVWNCVSGKLLKSFGKNIEVL